MVCMLRRLTCTSIGSTDAFPPGHLHQRGRGGGRFAGWPDRREPGAAEPTNQLRPMCNSSYMCTCKTHRRKGSCAVFSTTPRARACLHSTPATLICYEYGQDIPEVGGWGVDSGSSTSSSVLVVVYPDGIYSTCTAGRPAGAGCCSCCIAMASGVSDCECDRRQAHLLLFYTRA